MIRLESLFLAMTFSVISPSARMAIITDAANEIPTVLFENYGQSRVFTVAARLRAK